MNEQCSDCGGVGRIDIHLDARGSGALADPMPICPSCEGEGTIAIFDHIGDMAKEDVDI